MNTSISMTFSGPLADMLDMFAHVTPILLAYEDKGVATHILENPAAPTFLDAPKGAKTVKVAKATLAKFAEKAPRTANQIAHDQLMAKKSAIRKELGMKGFGKDTPEQEAELARRMALPESVVDVSLAVPAQKKVAAKPKTAPDSPEVKAAFDKRMADAEARTREALAEGQKAHAAEVAKKAAAKPAVKPARRTDPTAKK